MSKIYELFVHWKQGDDFHSHLEASNNKVAPALKSWADSMRANASRLDALAAAIVTSDPTLEITADADTHHIGFQGDELLLESLAAQGLLNCEDLEDEDYDDEDDAEGS